MTIAATASDNVGVSRVEFYDGSTLVGSDITAPYSYAWSFTSSNNGTHSWTAKAFDAAGNARTSSVVSLTVNIGVVDATPPSTSLTSPTSGTTYTTPTTVTVSATANDNVGVARVEFYRNGALQGTDTSSPYSYGWSVSSATNGSHSWTAKAYDAAGNAATSAASSVTVSIDGTAPTVSITSPASGTSYSAASTVTIAASASDNVGVSKVEFYDNGALASTDTSSPYSHAWSFTSSNNGTHSWTARAYDAAGNVTTSSAVSLTVNIAAADTTAPTVSITSPASGASYSSAQTVTVTASASDNVGVSRVEFYLDGVQKGIVTAAPFTYGWAITSTDNGSHSWTAKAYDAAGNTTTSSAVGVTVNIAAADTTKPTVSITSPASGTSYTTAQTVTINASASDNVGVTRVDFYDGATLKGSDATAPFSYAWSVSSSVNGTHSWTARAYDAAGNNTTSGAVSLSVNVVASANGGTHLWSRKFGGTRTDKGQGVTVDASGNVIKTGFYSGAADFNGTTLPCSATRNLVLAKYDVNGTPLWARCVSGGTGTITPNAVAIAQDGSIVVVGEFTVSVTFGSQTLVSVGDTDVFVAKYSSSGDVLWALRYGGSLGDKGQGVAIDDYGDIAVTGGLQNPDTIFVSKYSPAGALKWTRSFTGAGSNLGRAVATDAVGNVLMAGVFYGTIQLSGTTTSLTSVPTWYSDLLLAKFDPSGNLLWAKRLGGGATEWAGDVALDRASGEALLTGSFDGTVDFGAGPVTANGSDLFLAKFNASGNHVWSTTYGGMGNDVGQAVTVDPVTGDVFLGGTFDNSKSFGGSTFTSNGSADIVIARYAADTGAHKWSKAFGGIYADGVKDLATDGAGHLNATGDFVVSIDFGGGALAGDAGYGDAYVLQLVP